MRSGEHAARPATLVARDALRGLVRRTSWAVPLVVMVGVSALVWQPPSGVMLNGAILGGLSAMVAVGIALVYRAHRALNFAAADLGLLPALLSVLLLTAWGWPWWLAVVCGGAASVLLGALSEWLVIRRFFRAPRLILTVATIGLAQLFVAISLFMPRWFGGGRLNALTFDGPIKSGFTFGGVRFSGDDALALVVMPLALVALAVFLRYSRVGVALRGAAESADRAALLGIPVQRIHTVVWMVAGGLAFVAIFLRAGIVGTSIGQVLGPGLLLRALAAAVIGRMERFTVIVAAAIGLGVLEQSVKYGWDLQGYRDAVVALVVVVGLLATRGRTGRSAEVSTWQAAREVRPIPSELRGLIEVRVARWVVGVAVAGFLLTLPLWLGVGRLDLAGAIAIFGIVALSLVVLTGWAGQVSLGQMAFVGLGGAAAGSVTSRLHWDLALALLVGGVVGALVCVLVGLATLRARGLAFAVATLALALVTQTFLLNPVFFGGSRARFVDWLPGRVERVELLGTIPTDGDRAFYYLALVFLGLALVMVRNLRASRTGRVLIAARENERQAAAYGVHVRRAAVTAFACSGFLCGVAGGLLVHQQQGLQTAAFSPGASLEVFAMVVVGGLGSIGGAVLGAVYVQSVAWFLVAQWKLLATGAGLLIVLMLLPGGLGAALGDLRDLGLRTIAKRRGIRVPSLVADTRVEVVATPEMAEAVADATDQSSVPEPAS